MITLACEIIVIKLDWVSLIRFVMWLFLSLQCASARIYGHQIRGKAKLTSNNCMTHVMRIKKMISVFFHFIFFLNRLEVGEITENFSFSFFFFVCHWIATAIKMSIFSIKKIQRIMPRTQLHYMWNSDDEWSSNWSQFVICHNCFLHQSENGGKKSRKNYRSKLKFQYLQMQIHKWDGVWFWIQFRD